MAVLAGVGLKLQLDWYLCQQEHDARLRTYGDIGKAANKSSLLCKQDLIDASLELVYYCWFEERQLARGARILAKVQFRQIWHRLCILTSRAKADITSHGTSGGTPAGSAVRDCDRF